jgi:hypothetical protein
MSTAAAASSAFASSGGVDQRVLRSSNARTKRLLKRLLKRQMTEPVTAEANSSTSSGRKRKAEEVEGSTAKKSNGEPQVTITELSKDSEGQP